jgi:lipoyl(octanoyl) transferase
VQAIIRDLGIADYETTWREMQQFTLERTDATPDEIWTLEHQPVFTLGLNGKRQHVLNSDTIPVVHCDRGGQVTYHGPGQVVIYPLLDIKRLKLGIRQLVTLLENSMVDMLAELGIAAVAKPEAPGVYVADKKIGSIGVRIKRDCSYHGLSFNNDMDLSPFKRINPCGFQNLEMTQLRDFGIHMHSSAVAVRLIHHLTTALYL